MPYLVKKRAQSWNPSMSSSQYSDDVDVSLCELAGYVLDSGWDVDYRYHYSYVQTNADMVHFGGGVTFVQIIPPAGYAGLIPMVIDVLPDGYIPPPTHYIFAITGTTDKAICHEAIVQAMMSFDGRITIYGTNSADEFPNTLLGWKEYDGSTFAAARAPLHGNRSPFGAPAVGLHTNVSGLANGGYACRCAPNGSPDNFTSMFLYRNNTGGINPNQPSILFCKELPLVSPVTGYGIGKTPLTDCSGGAFIDFTKTDTMIAVGPSHFVMAQASGAANAHAATAALSLPIHDGVDVTVAVFGVAGSVGGASFGFRTTLSESANNGGIYSNINGEENFQSLSPTVQVIRVMNLFQQNDGLKWTNGLAQVQEPWIGFQVKTGVTPAPALGKLPGAIVVSGAFDADVAPARKWDNARWVPFTKNNTRGTLFFRDDSTTVADPTCTVVE